MSYVVLARKYRPRRFAEMVGQTHVVQALGHALATKRLHHAYLFTGTRGVGKTTVSRILAKSLNCVGADGRGDITAEPCGVCQACTDIDAGRFVDYTELDAASNRGVDEVQALLEQAVYKPVQGRFKVFMIDEVHMLTGHAFNAMLKTLEEPPPYLKFVLATTDPQKVPVTVLSRCLQFNLRPMAPDTVAEHLQHVLRLENIEAEPAALHALARGARGSMRDALSLTDQAIAFGGGRLQADAVRQMLGAADRGHVLQLLEALAAGEGATVVQTVDRLRVHGLNAASTLDEMIGLLQRMAVWQVAPPAVLPVDEPDAATLLRLAQALPPDETQLLYSLCLHGRQELSLAPDEYAALVMVLLRLLAFKPSTEKKSLTQASNPSPAAETPSPFRSAPPPEVRPAAPPPPQVAAAPVVPALDGVEHPPRSVVRGQGGGRFDPVAPPEEPDLPPWDALPAASAPPQPPVESQALQAAAGSSMRTSALGDRWFDIVQALIRTEAITALVRELAVQAQLVAQEGGVWRLRLARSTLNQPGNRDRLQQALGLAGHAVESLEVEHGVVDDTPAQRLAAEAERRQRAAEAAIAADPFVQDMMRTFGGKIVPGSIKPLAD